MDSTKLSSDYVLIEEEYKLCSEGCKQSGQADIVACNSKCGEIFMGSIKALYDNFYKKKVGSRKEYKATKK